MGFKVRGNMQKIMQIIKETNSIERDENHAKMQVR